MKKILMAVSVLLTAFAAAANEPGLSAEDGFRQTTVLEKSVDQACQKEAEKFMCAEDGAVLIAGKGLLKCLDRNAKPKSVLGPNCRQALDTLRDWVKKIENLNDAVFSIASCDDYTSVRKQLRAEPRNTDEIENDIEILLRRSEAKSKLCTSPAGGSPPQPPSR